MKKIISVLSLGLLLLASISCVKEKVVFDATTAKAPVILASNYEGGVITASYTPAEFNQSFNTKIPAKHTFVVKTAGLRPIEQVLNSDDKDNVVSATEGSLSKVLARNGYVDGDVVNVVLVVRGVMQGVVDNGTGYGGVESAETVDLQDFVVKLGSPYKDYEKASAWSLIGSMSEYGISWDNDLNMWTDGAGNHVAAHVALKKGDEVKFRKDQAWTVNMGGTMAAVDAEFAVSQGGDNIKIEADGVYDLFLYLNEDETAGKAMVAAAYDPYPELTKASTWGVTGAIPDHGINWDKDIAMVTDKDEKTHAAFGVSLGASDEFKFRKDAAWAVNLGGTFASLDSEFSVKANGDNVKVGAKGLYDLFVMPNEDGSEGKAKVTEACGLKISSIIKAEEEEEPGEDEPEAVTGWNIIGLNGDWDNDVRATEKDGVWSAYITAKEATAFKWRKDGGWDENYGIAKDAAYNFGTAFAAVKGGENININKGFYKVVLDLSTDNPTITLYNDVEVWSLIGDFNSWGGDVDMEEVEAGVWKSPATKLNNKGFKIRKNHDWGTSYGGTFVSLGTAFDATTTDNNNIMLADDGEYIVTFDAKNLKITVEGALPSNTWSLIGVNGDWDNDIFMTELIPGVWVSPKVEIKSAGWKLRFNHDWGVNRGSEELTTEGVFVKGVQEGKNIALTGTFKVVYNENTGTIGTLKWGIVGSIASIEGFSWNNDVPMNLGSDGKWYSIPVVLAATDEIKIRQDADWVVDRGGDCTEADAAFAVNQGGHNIKAPKAGTYMVVYDPTAETITLSTDFWSLIGSFSSWNSDRFMTFDGANWVAYNQALKNEDWKIRHAADWALSVGGVYATAGTAFDAVSADGPNIKVTDLESFDVVYDVTAQKITVK